MTYDERRRSGKTICARLVEDIASVATPGLGLWPEAWDVVAQESADFMEGLLHWEETGDQRLIDRVSIAYDRLVAAWADAARLYEVRQQEIAE